LFHNSVVHNQCKQLQKNLLEFTEFLTTKADLTQLRFKLQAKVAYMDACQALRECQIKESPRQLLSKIDGLEWVELADQETCCGFGGIYSVRNETESVSFGNRKLDLAMEAGVEHIVSTHVSCLMHLESIITQKKLNPEVMHIADLLAKSIV